MRFIISVSQCTYSDKQGAGKNNPWSILVLEASPLTRSGTLVDGLFVSLYGAVQYAFDDRPLFNTE
jgi:hypothetical protein